MISLKHIFRTLIYLSSISFLLVACKGSTIIEAHFEGHADIFNSQSTTPIKTAVITDVALPPKSSILFPLLGIHLNQVSMEIWLSSAFSGWTIQNHTTKPIKLKFDELTCVDEKNTSLRTLPMSGFDSGIKGVKVNKTNVIRVPKAITLEIEPQTTRWINFYTLKPQTLLRDCGWHQNQESPTNITDIKDLEQLIGKQFALSLPYEIEGETGHYLFRLKIKNIGSRTSYF